MRRTETRLLAGDCIEAMASMPADSVDSVVTDPPYGIGYLQSGWDDFGSARGFGEFSQRWGEAALRVLKPGGYVAAFCSSAMYHRMACGLEDAGLVTKASVIWLHRHSIGDRRPSVGKQIDLLRYRQRTGRSIHAAHAPNHPDGDPFRAYGTRLTVRHEPIGVFQRPLLRDSVAETALAHGTGGMRKRATRGLMPERPEGPGAPGTVVIDSSLVDDLEAECGPDTARMFMIVRGAHNIGEKEMGLEAESETRTNSYASTSRLPARPRRNLHPTAKPVMLVRYLQRLLTPAGGRTLDPFLGSGSHGIAAMLEGLDFVGIERDGTFLRLARKRIDRARRDPERFHLDSAAWRYRRDAGEDDLV